jgi:hypothetical protein
MVVGAVCCELVSAFRLRKPLLCRESTGKLDPVSAWCGDIGRRFARCAVSYRRFPWSPGAGNSLKASREVGEGRKQRSGRGLVELGSAEPCVGILQIVLLVAIDQPEQRRREPILLEQRLGSQIDTGVVSQPVLGFDWLEVG